MWGKHPFLGHQKDWLHCCATVTLSQIVTSEDVVWGCDKKVAAMP